MRGRNGLTDAIVIMVAILIAIYPLLLVKFWPFSWSQPKLIDAIPLMGWSATFACIFVYVYFTYFGGKRKRR